jgi:hypothetical protein
MAKDRKVTSRRARALLLALALSFMLPSCMDLELAQPRLEQVKEPALPASDASAPVDAGTVQGTSPELDRDHDATPTVRDPDQHEGSAPSETPAFDPPACAPLSSVVADASLTLCWSGAHLYEPARTWWAASSNLF